MASFSHNYLFKGVTWGVRPATHEFVQGHSSVPNSIRSLSFGSSFTTGLPPGLPVPTYPVGTAPSPPPTPTSLRVAARRKCVQGTPRSSVTVYLGGKGILGNQPCKLCPLLPCGSWLGHLLSYWLSTPMQCYFWLPSPLTFSGSGAPQLPLPSTTPSAHSPEVRRHPSPLALSCPVGPWGQWHSFLLFTVPFILFIVPSVGETATWG